VLAFKVFTHPLNEVVLEYPLDELVEQVRSYELVDVRIGEVVCERLRHIEFGLQIILINLGRLTVASLTMP
jgi:hypothetical protein